MTQIKQITVVERVYPVGIWLTSPVTARVEVSVAGAITRAEALTLLPGAISAANSIAERGWSPASCDWSDGATSAEWTLDLEGRDVDVANAIMRLRTRRYYCSMSSVRDNESNVISLDAARRRRDETEECRLEQLVIERWTGPDENERTT